MYVITGATGHTGKIVAQLLLEEGKKVRAIGRDLQRLGPLTDAGAEPAVCDLTDGPALAKAFAGAKAAYIMIPPNMASTDYVAYQDRVINAVASAIKAAGVKYAVVLSSYGADKDSGTGPVLGLHKLEERLNAIDGLNLLNLRAGYFMENTLAQAGIIHAMDTAAGPLRPDLRLPMIASRDIGHYAADQLLQLKFTGRQTRELQGQRDITMVEAARVIGHAIGKPNLNYVKIPDSDFKQAVLKMGMSENFTSLMLEMCAALNSGHMRALEPRSAANTMPTSYETFVADEFLPLYEGRMAHA
jgi:uncharacterized protein YbjT (DUF2867 family)